MRQALARFVEQRTIKRLQKLIFRILPKGGMVLDCGSGNRGSWGYINARCEFAVTFGGNSEQYQYTVYGIDKQFGQDCTRLDFRDEMFDTVVFAGVIQYLDDGAKALLEIQRVLKQGGIMIIATVNNSCLWRRLGIISTNLKADEKYIYDYNEMREMLKTNIVKEYGIDFIPLPRNLCSNMVFAVVKP